MRDDGREDVDVLEEYGTEWKKQQEMQKKEMNESKTTIVEHRVDLPRKAKDSVLDLLVFIHHFDVLYQHFKL